jgi:hypothetical protein
VFEGKQTATARDSRKFLFRRITLLRKQKKKKTKEARILNCFVCLYTSHNGWSVTGPKQARLYPDAEVHRTFLCKSKLVSGQ